MSSRVGLEMTSVLLRQRVKERISRGQILPFFGMHLGNVLGLRKLHRQLGQPKNLGRAEAGQKVNAMIPRGALASYCSNVWSARSISASAPGATFEAGGVVS